MSPFLSIRFLQSQSDVRLLALARRGHERAFEALVHRYRRPLLAHCRRLLGSEARAEDGLQQGLMQAWIALQRGTEVREVRPWLHRVVHNASLNLMRGRTETTALEESMEVAGASESDVERRMAVREALAGVAALPLMQREALLRTAVDGHSHEQVASALGLSDGAVRGLIYRARATLRAGVTAVTPAPVVNWVAATAARPSLPPMAQRLTELAGGGGSAGAAALLIKGGAAVVTAGAVVAGVAAPVVHLASHPAKPAITSSAGAQSPGSTAGVPAAIQTRDVGLVQSHGGRSGGAASGKVPGRAPLRGRPGEHGSGHTPATLGPGSRAGGGSSPGRSDDSHQQTLGTGGSGEGPSSHSGGGSSQTSSGGDGGSKQLSGGSGSSDGGTSNGSLSGGSGSTSGGSGSTSGGSGSTSDGSGSTSGGSGSTSGGSGSTSGGSGSTSGGDGLSGDPVTSSSLSGDRAYTSGSSGGSGTSDGGASSNTSGSSASTSTSSTSSNLH